MTKAQQSLLAAITAICWLLAPSQAQAQAEGGTIQISTQGVGVGSITCGGTYTLVPGWTVNTITLYANPINGGAQSSAGASFGAGNWGNTTINGLTSKAKYTVWASMVITKGVNMQTINSATTVLTPK